MPAHPFFSLFDDPAAWQVFASGQSEGSITRIRTTEGSAGLRLEYDFHGGGGFVVMRRVIPFTLPGTFEIGFSLRGEGLANNFEFKIADPGNTNVWRRLRENVELPDAWTAIRFHERDLPFAWGPAGGGAPKEVGSVEFAIVAGSGGKGVLELVSPMLEDQTMQIAACDHRFQPSAGLSAGSGVHLGTPNRLAGGSRRPATRVGSGFRQTLALRRNGHHLAGVPAAAEVRSGDFRRWQHVDIDPSFHLGARIEEPHPDARSGGAAPPFHLR